MELPEELCDLIVGYFDPYDIKSHNAYKLINKQFYAMIIKLHSKIPDEIIVNIQTGPAKWFPLSCRSDSDFGSKLFVNAKPKFPENEVIKNHVKESSIKINKMDMIKGNYIRYCRGCYTDIFIPFSIHIMLNTDYTQKCNNITIMHDFQYNTDMIYYDFV